jgi:hypothetical protein
VKINDLLDNMDITRLQTLTEADVKRLNKYLRAYKRIVMNTTVKRWKAMI